MSAEEASAVRPAAVVVLLREAATGPEVLLVKRAAQLAFYAGAWVFPGGRIDAVDGDLETALQAAARNAAVRELQEEAGLTLLPSDLAEASRWLTPPGRARRFDTFYFAALAPDAEVRTDPSEVAEHAWLAPVDALAARARGAIELPPPAFVTLSVLAGAATAAAALGVLAGGARLQHYIPKACAVDGGVVYLYAGDAGYDASDPQAPGVRHRLSTRGLDWQYERTALA